MAVLLAAAAPTGAGFVKQANATPVEITIDWGAPGVAPPDTSDCMGALSDGELCNGNGSGRAPSGTGDPDACSSFGWETGHGSTGGIYSAVRHDGLGPRGAGRPYWAVCVKDSGNATAGRNSTAYASVRYTLNLDNYVPRDLFIYSADLSLDYTVDAGDFDENGSRAALYGFIRDLDTGLYYKIRGDQSRGNPVRGATDEELGGWHGCDYLDVWDARVAPRRPSDDPYAPRHDPGVCESGNGSAKASPRMEASRNRSFNLVCSTAAPNLTFGQDFGYGGRCQDYNSLASFLGSKATTSRRFELLFRLVVQLDPGAGRSEKFALTFDDPVFLKGNPPATPRYGATFSYGENIPLSCYVGTVGTLTTIYVQDHNKEAGEFVPAGLSGLTNGAGYLNVTWTATSPQNGIFDYMTGFWLRCNSAGQPDDYTKIYLINKDPEVYLRGRAYYTFLPCVGVDVTQGGDDCQDIKGNPEASSGDHDEFTCENGCDLAEEPGKLWITIKLGKRGAGGYSTSRQPVSGDGGVWTGADLAQAALLGCTSETSCAGENTAGSFRLANENQQGDNLAHSANLDLNNDGVPDLTPSYPADGAGDYDQDDGRVGTSYAPGVTALTGSDSSTLARVVPNCWSQQPASADGTHPNWRGGFNDCEFMYGRWAKFLFGAASFRGDGTVSMDYFWWTVGLWLDDKHVFALGQHTPTAACVPTMDTDHDDAAFGADIQAHVACIPDLPVGPTTPLKSPAAAAGVKIWIANTVQGCDSWSTCRGITDFTDYVNRTLKTWNRLTSNLMDDLANFSETYPGDGGPTSITALANHFLRIFGEPAYSNTADPNSRYVAVGGGTCSTPGTAMGPPDPPLGGGSPKNPAGIFSDMLRVTAASMHATNDPFSLGTDPPVVETAGFVRVDVGCAHAAMGDIKPPLRDGAALTLPAASYLLQDRRDMWFIRLNNPGVRSSLEAWFQNITVKYAKGIGPSNGSSGLNYFLKGLVNADPKAWSDVLTSSFENSRDFKFFGGVLLNEQMARAFAANSTKMPGSNPDGSGPPCFEGPTWPNSGCNWGDGVNEAANNQSAVQFVAAALDMLTQGLQQYNLLQRYMNDKNPAAIEANAEAKWGFNYWFLKTLNTYFNRMPQDKFNASREESARWIAVNNYGNPGSVDYLGAARGPAGGCGNWVYDRSAHTTSDPDRSGDGIPGDDDTNDDHYHDTTAYTDNGFKRGTEDLYNPMQYRHDVNLKVYIWLFVWIKVYDANNEAGNPVKQDAGYGNIDSGWNYLLCRLKYVSDETYKNLADALLETIGQMYKSFWAMTRYGQNAVPAIGEEPTVPDVSTQLVSFLTNYLDYYRLRPAAMLYDDALLGQEEPALGFSGNNDYYFENTVYTNATCPNLVGTRPGVVINCEPFGQFNCRGSSPTDQVARAKRCRDRYYYEKAGYNLFLYEFALKILNNIDFGPAGSFYNLTKLRVERAADLAGDPQGAVNGVTYALNYGRNVDPVVRQKFAQTITDYVPYYLRSRFDAADQDFRFAPQQRLDYQTAKTKLQSFAARWFGDWGDLMFNLRGAKAEYYNCGGSCAGNPFPEPVYLPQTDDNVSLNWGTNSPDPVLPADGFSARWTFKLNVLSARNYTIRYCWDGGINLTIDGTKRSSTAEWSTPSNSCSNYALDLSVGLHDFLVEYYDDTGTASVDLRWNLSGTCCESIPKERYYPPYPYDYTFKTAGAVRWIFALFNTLYESFTPEQNTAIAKTIAQNLSRYFGDEDGCSGQTGTYHTQIGRQNVRCGSNPNGADSGDPLVNGMDATTVREQHEVITRALSSLFKALGLAFKQLPNALPDLSSTTTEGIVFLRHATEAVKNVMDQINALPLTQKNITYDRYWAREVWALKSFQYFVNLGGAGVMAGPLKVSATPGQIGSAGAGLASNLHDIFGDPQARSGLNYLLTTLRAEDETQLQTFTGDLLSALLAYVKFQAERAIRFPAVLLPSARANSSIQQYSQLSLFQKANGTLGLRYLLDPVNEISGLWGKYYDTSNVAGSLYVASDGGALCRLTDRVGTATAVNDFGSSHAVFSDYDGIGGNRWDYQADASSSVRTGPVLITCEVNNGAGGNGGFDAALKVGARFRVQRSDDDSNYHVTLPGTAPQIPGCTQSFTQGSYCYTQDYDCSSNELWRYATSQPAGWWPVTSAYNIGDEITTQDLTDGVAGRAPYDTATETWGCTSGVPSPGTLYVWKRVDIDPFEDGELILHRNDRVVDFCPGSGCSGSPGTGLGSDNFAVRWTGKLQVPTTKDWNLTVCANDGFRLYVDGVALVDRWVDTATGTTQCSGWSGRLEAALHDIQLDYYERSGTAEAHLQWNLTGTCPGCPIIANDYLFTRDPDQYNQSAQSFFGIVYGWAGALNTLYTLASKSALQQIFNTMSDRFPEYWGSFGGVFGRSYHYRYESENSSFDSYRDQYARGTLSTYRNLITLAGKVGEQAQFALPNATPNGFVRLWDTALPASPGTGDLRDLCTVATNGLSASAKRAYYYGEDTYPEAWTTKAFRINVRNYLNGVSNCVSASFANLTTASDLATAMRNNATDSVIVMLKDVCPETVCDLPLPNAVVYYDTGYPTAWIPAARALNIANFLNQTGFTGASDPRNPAGTPCANQSGPSAPCGRAFVRYNAAQLAAWMQNMSSKDRARGSVAVFSQDICPSTVCENMTKDNTIARFLAAGGRVVWAGSAPFYYQGLSGGGVVVWGYDGEKKILGLSCEDANGTTSDCDAPSGVYATRTADASRWGLANPWYSKRPVSYTIADSTFVGRYWNYFNSGVYGATPTVVRNDTVLDFWFWRNCPQWAYDCDPGYAALRPGAGSPHRGIPVDTFASEWTGTFYQPVTGTVTFTSDGDDARVALVDGSEVVDVGGLYPTPGSCPGTTASGSNTVALTRGFHTLVYRQCEATGNAGAQLTVSGPGWPGPTGLRSVRAALPPGTTVFATHPQAGSYQGTLLTNVSAFFRNYNPVHPDSGFVRIWDCSPGSNCSWDITGNPGDARLQDLWNVSTYNLSVEVHAGELGTGNATSSFRVPDINMAGNDSLLKDYMRRGGRVVWLGATPMFYQGHAGASPNGGNLTQWDYGGEDKLLGVRTSDPYSPAQQSSRSWEGVMSLGLSSDSAATIDTTLRPAYAKDVTYTYRKDAKGNASWWFKEMNDSIVSYKRRTTEFRTHVLEALSMFINALQGVGDWESKLATYWGDRYWVQQSAIASYKAWMRQSDLLRQLGTDAVNASITLIGKNESQGISYIWRAELTVDWTAGRGPWGQALLNYGSNYFGFLSQSMWNASAGIRGLGVNTTLRYATLSLNRQAAGSTGTWTGVSQP